MAAVKSYQVKTGRNGKERTRWRVRYHTPDGRQTDKKGFTTKRDAEQFAAAVEVEKMTGSYIAPKLGMVTVEDLSAPWLARKRSLAPSHYRTLETAWRVHVAPRWGTVRVADVDLDAVETWVAQMRESHGATAVIRSYGVLAGILDSAVKAKRLRVNPARGIDNLPTKTSKRHIYLSHDDVRRLATEAGEHGTLVLVLAYTGIRWGEAVALRVRDVEFLRRRISVHANAVQLGVEHHVGTPKGKEARSVPVPGFVLDALARQVEDRDRDTLVFGDGTNFLPRPKSDGGWFAGAVKRAGVQQITPHDLRHSCAGLTVSAGGSVLALARMLGHKDPSVTLRVYADLFDADLDRLADTLHSAYQGPTGGDLGAQAPSGIEPRAVKSL